MTIYGTALLALCVLLGGLAGELLGVAFHVKANVGGVGLAMLLLVAVRAWLVRRGLFNDGIRLGVQFWALMYIPIVVAMAAQQNVVAAVDGGPMVIVTGLTAVILCFGLVALVGRAGRAR